MEKQTNNKKAPRITFIAWAKYGYDRRNDLLANRIGASMHYVYWGRHGKLFLTPLRYIVQSWQTMRILIHEHPDVVVTHNPPIFCVLVAFIYAKLFKANYVIDSHTGAFLSKAWRWSLGLHRMLSKRAIVTIVHNNHQKAIVEQWGYRYCVLGSFGSDYPEGIPFSVQGKFNVAVIGSIYKEERLDIVFEAAQKLSDVRFYVTGHSNRIGSELLDKKPDNCILTDFLPDEHYIGLLRSVDAILTLTKGDHRVLMGAFEAVAVEKPLITSNWQTLKQQFTIGTVHIPNTAEGLYEGVRQAREKQEALQRDIVILRKQLINEWEQEYRKLRHFIDRKIRSYNAA